MISNNYRQALEHQALRQGRDLTPLNLAVAEIVETTCNKAILDVRSNIESKTFNVITAPTGSSKTQSTIAYAIHKFKEDPEFSCTFIVGQIRNAEEVYQELLKGIPEEHLGVWSGFHDLKQHNPLDIKSFGFKPCLSTEEEVKHKRIAVFTHKKWEYNKEDKEQPDFGIRFWNGKKRDVLFIDELPEFVYIIQQQPSDILRMRDHLLSTMGEKHKAVELLTDVVDRMEEIFTTTGVEMIPTPLTSVLSNEELLVEMESYEFREKYAKPYTTDFDSVVKFLRAIALGYVFLTRAIPRSFVAYLPKFKPDSNIIVLDATADITGLYPLVGGHMVENMPKIDYSNLTITQIEPPKDFKATFKVLKKRDKAVEYANWIKKLVMENSRVGDRILIVLHKDLIATHGLFKESPLEPEGDSFTGRQSNIIVWGSGIGSNHYNQCSKVFLIGEFYKPKRVVISTKLGVKEEQPSTEELASQNGSLSNEFKEIAEGDLLRWLKQLASRGTIRNIDSEGKCAPMELITTGKWERLVNNLESLFPNAKAPQRNLGKSKKPKTGREELVNILSTTTNPRVSFADLERMTGIPRRDISRSLKASSVAPTVKAYDWKLTTNKELGLTGKGQWLTRGQ